MIQEFKRVFRALTPLSRASAELQEAELSLLDSQSTLEHAEATVAYNLKRVTRLRAYISDETFRRTE